MHKINVFTTKVKVTIAGHMFTTYKSCVSHNSKPNKGNVTNFTER